ncbi:hypothetical protein NKG05_13565 [Oerskovia sp. M15]
MAHSGARGRCAGARAHGTLWLAIRVTRIPFVLAVTGMHASIWAFLGLDYSAWVLTAAAVAVPMALRPERRLLGRLLGHRPGRGRRGPRTPDRRRRGWTRTCLSGCGGCGASSSGARPGGDPAGGE